jgi:hypothetical protein
MLTYLMRQTLLDALSAGPPYEVFIRHINARSRVDLLMELERRGLITRGPFPVLTENGIAEAKWFAIPARPSDAEKDSDEGQRG